MPRFLLITYFVLVNFIFLVSLPWGNTQDSNFRSIVCHRCTPLTEGVNCAELGTNETLGDCTNLGISDVIVTCYSAYFIYDYATYPGVGKEDSGVYRGCAMRQENYTDFCALHREEFAPINVTIVSCAECNEEGCNSHRFNAEGFLIDGGNVLVPVSGIVLVVCSFILFNSHF